MPAQIYRVVVRGQFDGLDDDQRQALVAEVDEHDIFKAAYTEWGTFTYEPNLVSFSFRYEVRSDDDADPPVDPVAEGLARATASLDGWGLAAKHLRATATAMADLWSDRSP